MTNDRSMFRAIVWKELREGAKVGIPAFLVFVAASWLPTAINAFEVGGNTITISPDPSLGIFQLAAALAASMIGITQLIRERRGDRWAFLTHRPVDRSLVFWGKTVAGLAWYTIAVGLPTLALFFWRMQPSHQSTPWVPRLMLADLVDFIGGSAFYFAAQLVMLLHSRWFGSRVIPLVGAFAWLAALATIKWLDAASIQVAIGLVAAVTAARAVFVAGGYHAALMRSGRTALSVALAPGMFVVLGIMVFAVGAIPLGHTEQARTFRTTYAMLARDGSIVRNVVSYDRVNGATTPVGIEGLDGKRRADLEDSTSTPHLSASENVVTTPFVPLNLTAEYVNTGFHGFRGARDVFTEIAMPATFGREALFYRHDLRVVDVFRSGMNPRHIGWFGPDGYLAGDTLPSHRFDGTLRPYTEWENAQPLVVLPHAVYRIDPRRNTIRRVFSTNADEEIIGAAGTGDSARIGRLGAPAQFDVIATARAVYIQPWDGSASIAVPHDSSVAAFGQVRVERALDAPGAPTFVWYSPQYGRFPASVADTTQDRVFQIGADGHMVARTVFRSSTGGVPPSVDWEQIVATAAMKPLAFLAYDAVVIKAPEGPLFSPAPDRRATHVGWATTVAGSLIAMLLVWLRARRYAFTRGELTAWVASAALFGLVVPLVMLAVYDWPARVPCPSCTRGRLVTRETCEHCGAPFAPPRREGFEVFASAA